MTRLVGLAPHQPLAVLPGAQPFALAAVAASGTVPLPGQSALDGAAPIH